MHCSNLKRWSSRLMALLALSLLLLARAQEDPERERCVALPERLTQRVQNASEDREKLRNDLLALRGRQPGTSIALKASALLRQLPSALDQLDPSSIPDLEKHAWQPKELG